MLQIQSQVFTRYNEEYLELRKETLQFSLN